MNAAEEQVKWPRLVHHPAAAPVAKRSGRSPGAAINFPRSRPPTVK